MRGFLCAISDHELSLAVLSFEGCEEYVEGSIHISSCNSIRVATANLNFIPY